MLAVTFVVLAGVAFVASIRLGILLGRRLDRSIEERGREENRGE
ncbi:MAG: hypothetical protein ABSC46_02505 [Candidatus Limnocylindrales bacterium]